MTRRFCFPVLRGVLGWSLLTLLIVPVVAWALSGQSSSGSGPLDSRPPEVTITFPSGGEELAGGDTYDLTWIIAEISDPVPVSVFYAIHYQEDIIASDFVDVELSGNYEVPWLVPDIEADNVRLAVTAIDPFGFSGTDTSLAFSIASTWVDAPTRNLPLASRLEPNYPNPFNPTTQLRFALHEAANIELAVYDLSGRKVAVLANGDWAAGIHQVSWHGTDLGGRTAASGTYLARLRIAGGTNSETMVQRMTLLK